MQIRKVYNFRTLAPSVLGAEFKNAKLTGIVDYASAIKRDTVDQRFKSIYALLDPAPVYDPTIYNYYIFKTEQGQDVVLCEVWIDMTSVVEAVGESYRITVRNTDSATMNRVKLAMTALNITDFNIEKY